MCQALGYRVVTLKRIRIMNHPRLGSLGYGQWRYLTQQELSELYKLLGSPDISLH